MLVFDIIYFVLRKAVLIYPILKTIGAIRTPRNPILIRWLTYWFIAGLLTNLSVLGYYLPFYGTIELIFLIVLQNKYLLNLVKRYLILNMIRDFKRIFNKFQESEIYQGLEGHYLIFLIHTVYQYFEMVND